jgi:hypothetical protein
VGEWLDLKRTLIAHCDRIGRDPSEITCSVNLRIAPDLGIGPAVSLAVAYRDAGVDLAIVNLPRVAKPDFLAPLADALAPLA